jgi:putative ABC transport system permease protein
VNELFGIPMDSLAVALVGLVGAALGLVAVLALRNRVLVRLGVRNATRRPGRTALIVVGLMLGTAIVSAALTTGDTMSYSIRALAVDVLGQTDELVTAKGEEIEAAVDQQSTNVEYFPERYVGEVRRALAGSPLVDGITPAIAESVAVQNPRSRQTEPRVTMAASDPASQGGFDVPRDEHGRAAPLTDLRPGEVYVNTDGADELQAKAGDVLLLYVAGRVERVRVRAVVSGDGEAASGPAVELPLSAAQVLLGQPGRVREILVSNRGGEISGAKLSDQVAERLRPTADRLGLEVTTVKQDVLDEGDQAGSAFMTFFTTFGSFSIMAGILLIFLIFVMLAAERRGELGIARAVGTRRGHLVQMFLFEGVAYDLLAAVVGAVLGAAVAYGMVLVMSRAFGVEGFDISYAVSPRSLVVAGALGLLLTLAVVAISAWRVSVLTISTAIRNLPEPIARRGRRRRWILGLVGVALGSLLTLAGASGGNGVQLWLGISLVIIGLVPVARALGVPERLAFTAAGVGLVVLWLLPWRLVESVFGELKMDFSIWIVSGFMVVVGAVWSIMYNADALAEAAMRVLGRIRALAPMLKMAMAYPLATRFRTGTTLAMFTLVVFTMVTGSATSGSFMNAFDDVDTFGGGYQVRATVSPTSPVPNLRAALRRAPGLDPTHIRAVGGVSYLPADARQAGTGRGFEEYPVQGLDRAFLQSTTYGFASTARGYSSSEDVWKALATRPGLAVVDGLVVPRRQNFNFGPMPDFRLSGLYVEDRHFDPVPIVVRDPRTGQTARLRVIGVLKDSVPIALLSGLLTSQETMTRSFGPRVRPTTYWFRLAPGVDPKAEASRLESAFLRNGMEAEALEETMHDLLGANLTFNRLILGFMGLGLIVGVAALGVISARSVVERRQQIGVLRSIGFRRGMVQASFLLESSFIALTAILVGSGLGLLLAHNIVDDSQQRQGWDNLTFQVPWVNLGVIFAVVYLVALATTLLPARRASRVYPAEALRYE